MTIIDTGMEASTTSVSTTTPGRKSRSCRICPPKADPPLAETPGRQSDTGNLMKDMDLLPMTGARREMMLHLAREARHTHGQMMVNLGKDLILMEVMIIYLLQMIILLIH